MFKGIFHDIYNYLKMYLAICDLQVLGIFRYRQTQYKHIRSKPLDQKQTLFNKCRWIQFFHFKRYLN